MKKIALAAGGLIAAAMMTTPAHAWNAIGSRDVKDRTERDTIAVNDGRSYRRIKICVYQRPVHFYDVDVIFENGGHQDVRVRKRIEPGKCTRVIDLEGGSRNIDRIHFVYEETSFARDHARVTVFADN